MEIIRFNSDRFLKRLFFGFLEQFLGVLSNEQAYGGAGRQPVHRFRGGVPPRKSAEAVAPDRYHRQYETVPELT